MQEYMKKRPQKKVFQVKEIAKLKDQAIENIKSKLLPNEKIIKIILIGSSVKNLFGEYEPPGFKGSLFSDFDFIVFVEEDYEIPSWLNKEPSGKPFPNDELNLAYRQTKFVENKYDVDVFFIRKTNMDNLKIQGWGEQAGIPMNSDTKHKYLMVYSKN